MKITAEKVFECTALTAEDFERSLEGFFKTGQKKPDGRTGIQVFIDDFMKEGWCKIEKPILLDEEIEEAINNYAEYWL